MKHTVRLIAAVLAALLAACASSGEPAPKKAKPATELAWSERTHEQRVELMKKVVKPQMAALFKGFDKEVYKEFSCKTCHGKNAKARHFEMPTPDLPKLDPTDHFKAHQKDSPKMLPFMMKKVAPTMAKLLHEKPWSPKNPKGFGCFSCHTRKGS